MNAVKSIVLSALVLGGACAALEADVINFTTDGSGFSVGSDSISNPAGVGSVNVPQNGSVVAPLMSGTLTIGFSFDVDGDHPFTLNPGMIANSVAGVLNIDGHIFISPSFDAVAYFNGGAPTVFNLGGGLILTVTPLPLDLGSFAQTGTTEYTIMADFALTPTPGASALLGVGMLASSRRRRA